MDSQASTAPGVISARRTARLSFTLSGRASRTELASYGLAALFVTLAVSFVTALFAPYPVRATVSDALTVILAIPIPALLVRRLHDQGRSGRLVWLAIFGFAVWLVRSVVANLLGTDSRIAFDEVTWMLDWAVILANLGAVIFAILPGMPGPNRFGPDPRQPSG